MSKLCNDKNNNLLTIRTGGRDLYTPYDDYSSIYKASSIHSNGSVTVQVLFLDSVDPGTKAGVVIRNSLASNGSYDSNTAAGYAAVVASPRDEVSFLWDSNGDGRLDSMSNIPKATPPLYARLDVSGTQFTGYFSSNGVQWTQIGNAVVIPTRLQVSDVGVLVSSHGGFINSTAVFANLTIC